MTTGDQALPRRRRGLVAGFVVVLVVAAVPIVASLVGGPRTHRGGLAVNSDAKESVLAALGTTVAAGGYDMTFTDHVTPGNGTTQTCTGKTPLAAGGGTGASGPVSVCTASGIAPRVDITGHGTVNLDPYAMVAVTNVSGLGEITIYVNGTTVWEIGGGNYGSTTGRPLSGFADLVEGTLGPGEGAVSMISLASHNGYLNLEDAAVHDAQPAGSGSVDGTAVTYYDVTIDVAKLVDAPDLTDEQRITIQNALPVLASAGYSGTEERIGVDDAGFIREVTATEHFSDGSAMSRHTILSNFGCASTVYTPDQPAPPVTTTVPCTSPDTTTTTTTSAPTTSTPSSTSTTPSSTASTTSTVAPTTSEPPTTSTSTTTTSSPPPTTSSP